MPSTAPPLNRSIFPSAIPSLGAYLLLGLALRIPAILFAEGYEFVDQQYQSIDPAWHLASGDDWLRTHEWVNGIRSWVFPWFLAGVFKLVGLLGIHESLAGMAATRAVFALIGLMPLAAFWLLVVKWRPLPDPRPALALFAVSGALLYASVQPSAPTFAAMLSTTALLLTVSPRPAGWFTAGLLLGLAFCCRFQEAIFGPVILAGAIFTGRWRLGLLFLAGCAGPVLLQGVVDLITWGAWFHSPLAYFKYNIVDGLATQWTTRPWWYYLAVGLIPYVLFVPPFIRVSAGTLRTAAHWLAIPLAAVAIYVLVHSFIPRKSMRFLLPAFTVLSAVLAVGLFAEPWRGMLRWYGRCLITLHLLGFLVFSFYQFNRGPVQAAAAIGRHESFTGELVLVDGNPTDAGGYYYLRRQRVAIQRSDRADLTATLEATPAAAKAIPIFVMSLRKPIGEDEFGGRVPQLLGAFTNWPDTSSSRRRYVYIVEAAGNAH